MRVCAVKQGGLLWHVVGQNKRGAGVAQSARSMATARTYLSGKHFFLDPFAERQWDDPSYKGGRITKSKAEFTDKVNAHFDARCERLHRRQTPP